MISNEDAREIVRFAKAKGRLAKIAADGMGVIIYHASDEDESHPDLCDTVLSMAEARDLLAE